MRVAVSSAFAVSIADASPLPWVPSPGHYNEVGANQFRDQVPCPDESCAYSGVEGWRSVCQTWNGGVYCGDVGALGAILLWGGGHSGYWGNEVYLFEFDSLQWRRITAPTLEVGAWGTGHDADGRYADGNPAPPHTYDNGRYVPAAGSGAAQGLYVMTAHSAVGGYSRSYWRSHIFDIANRTWSMSTNLIPPQARYDDPYGATAYDPIRNRIWFLDDATPSDIAFLDIPTRTWQSIPHGLERYNGASYNHCGAWCPLHDVMVINENAGTGRIWIWNPTTRALVAGVTAGTPPPKCGLEWCSHPQVQRFYAYGYTGTVVNTLTPPAADPMTGTWTWGTESFAPEDGAGAPGDVAYRLANSPSRYNAFAWAPQLSCFVWPGTHSGPVNLFRPAAAI